MADFFVEFSETERSVLDFIWRRGPVARVQIAEALGLSAMAVTRATKRLVDVGFLGDQVLREGKRGQPTRPLSVEPRVALSVGVYFSHSRFEAGLVDLNGVIVERVDRALSDPTPQAVAEAARSAVNTMLDRSGLEKSRLVGVGFALPGDFTRKPVLNAHSMFPGFAGVNALDVFQANLPFAVSIENDATSAAIGERLHGSGQNVDDFLLVHIGHGIGSGLVLNGVPYRGSHGNAGIIGVLFPNDKPRPSGQDLLANLEASGVPVNDFADLEAIHARGSAPLRAWIRRAGEQLRWGLSISARIVDPSTVIIGGRLPVPVLQAVTAEIDQPGFCDEGVGLPKPSLRTSTLGPTAGIIGAAAAPLYEHLFGV